MSKWIKRVLSVLLVYTLVSGAIIFAMPINAVSSIVPMVTAGSAHTAALKSDGTVWAWGSNFNGRLGDGTTTNRSTPVQVISLSGIIAISAGRGHTLALKSDGTVWAWGENNSDQLGYDGPRVIYRNSPVQVTSLSGITAISAGYSHSVALKNDGTVWAWGNNEYSQLGVGMPTTSRYTPVQVTSLSGITAISAGRNHTVALKNDGTVWAWGWNGAGQLGDGTTVDRSYPVQVTSLSGITAISAGFVHTVALKGEGIVWAWGAGSNGQLGNGATIAYSTPMQITSLSGITAISAGNNRTVALKSNGTVWACGDNSYGQLGDGSTINRLTPVQVVTLSGISAISTGDHQTVSFKSDGSVWTQGYNHVGQLGDGTITDRHTPVQVVGAYGVGKLNLLENETPSLTYTVTLDPNGGIVMLTSITVTNGGTYSALNALLTPIREGFIFDGWYTAASGGTKVSPTDTVNLTGNITLFAHWTPVPPDVEDYVPRANIDPNIQAAIWTIACQSELNNLYLSSTWPSTDFIIDYTQSWKATWREVLYPSLINGMKLKYGTILFEEQAQIDEARKVLLALLEDQDNLFKGQSWVDITVSLAGMVADSCSILTTTVDYQPINQILQTPESLKDSNRMKAIVNGTLKYAEKVGDIAKTSAKVLKTGNGIVTGSIDFYSKLTQDLADEGYAENEIEYITSLINSMPEFLLAFEQNPIFKSLEGVAAELGKLSDYALDKLFEVAKVRAADEKFIDMLTFIAGDNMLDVNRRAAQEFIDIYNGNSSNSDKIIKEGLKLGLDKLGTWVMDAAGKIVPGIAVFKSGVSFVSNASDLEFNQEKLTDNLQRLRFLVFFGYSISSWSRGKQLNWLNAKTLAEKNNTAEWFVYSVKALWRCRYLSEGIMEGLVEHYTNGEYGITAILNGWKKLLFETSLSEWISFGYEEPEILQWAKIACPVDVEIYDSQGDLVGKITNNEIDPSIETKVLLLVDGDIKYVVFPSEADYRVKLTGTNVGTMIYTVRETTVKDGAKKKEKEFKNVSLFSGKKMMSEITDTPDVTLLIMENDNPIGEIDINGHETLYTPHVVTVFNGSGGGNYVNRSIVTITANTAPSGQRFKQWNTSPAVTFTGGTSATSSTAKFTMPAQAVAATAVYENIPTSIVPMVSADEYHSVALKSDGTVWAWGHNHKGQLGDGTTADRSTPVQAQGLTNVTAISTNVYYYTVALKDDGTVWAWGRDVANGTTMYRSTPGQVQGISDVKAISAGYEHVVALKNGGTVWGWGSNWYGELGNGTTASRSATVQAQGISDVIAITAGACYTVALKSDGTVWAWGINDKGQLGDGTTTNRLTPVQVKNLSNIKAIDAGTSHTIALKNDGTVWVWGENDYGKLGDGTTTNCSTPKQIALSNVAAISASNCHSIALKSDGTVWAWGRNSYGAIGDGTNTERRTPTQTSGLSNMIAISAGSDLSLAIKNDGTVWAWGDGGYGALGNGGAEDSNKPVQVLGSGGTGKFNVYDPTSYTLTLNANGGTVTPTSVTQAQGTAYTLPTPSRSGFTFSSWMLSGGGTLSGNTYTFGTSNGTLTAQWTGNVAPGINGPTTMTLTAGYTATSTGVYTVTGNPAPTVTKTAGDAKITWNNSTKKLDIAAGLGAGTYPVTLTATSIAGTATASFTLTVNTATPTTYIVTVGSGAGGGSFTQGVTVTITANAAPSDKVFDKWTTSDGVTFANANNASTTFTMPAKNVTVTATYKDAAKKIFSTKYDATFLNWILFFVCFGWIWMWF